MFATGAPVRRAIRSAQIRGNVRRAFFKIKPVLAGPGAARSGGSEETVLSEWRRGARGRSAMSTSWLDQSGHSIESHVAPEPDRMGSVSRGGFGKRRGAV